MAACRTFNSRISIRSLAIRFAPPRASIQPAFSSFHTTARFRYAEDVEKDMDQAEARQEKTEGPAHDWKKRPPYSIHESNDKFKARYEANCHCGKVKYQLSRQEPLDSKLCHCTTCQTQHGESPIL